MKVSPNKKLSTGKFGVTLSPDRIYDASLVRGQPKRILVACDKAVLVLADKRYFTVLEE